MQSTKYRYLKAGEQILMTDEVATGKAWNTVGTVLLAPISNMVVSELAEKNMWYRRRLPHSGKVQFLMNVSALVSVIVDCDGKTQEEIEVDAGCLAVQKILANPTQYIHLENIDWGDCRVDDEEFQPEQELNEVGEIIEAGDECKFKISDDSAWIETDYFIGKSIEEGSGLEFRRFVK